MEDEKIVGLYLCRDEAAITETASKYGRLCRQVALGVLGSEEDAEECVNDAYARVWRSIPPDRPERLDAYVAKVTRRIAIDRYRKYTAEKRAPTVPLLDELAAALPAGEADAADKLAMRDALNLFLYSLSPTNRIIFMRRYWYCSSVREIAKLLHMSEMSVQMRLGRMKKKLRASLSDAGVEV